MYRYKEPEQEAEILSNLKHLASAKVDSKKISSPDLKDRSNLEPTDGTQEHKSLP